MSEPSSPESSPKAQVQTAVEAFTRTREASDPSTKINNPVVRAAAIEAIAHVLTVPNERFLEFAETVGTRAVEEEFPGKADADKSKYDFVALHNKVKGSKALNHSEYAGVAFIRGLVATIYTKLEMAKALNYETNLSLSEQDQADYDKGTNLSSEAWHQYTLKQPSRAPRPQSHTPRVRSQPPRGRK